MTDTRAARIAARFEQAARDFEAVGDVSSAEANRKLAAEWRARVEVREVV